MRTRSNFATPEDTDFHNNRSDNVTRQAKKVSWKFSSKLHYFLCLVIAGGMLSIFLIRMEVGLGTTIQVAPIKSKIDSIYHY